MVKKLCFLIVAFTVTAEWNALAEGFPCSASWKAWAWFGRLGLIWITRWGNMLMGVSMWFFHIFMEHKETRFKRFYSVIEAVIFHRWFSSKESPQLAMCYWPLKAVFIKEVTYEQGKCTTWPKPSSRRCQTLERISGISWRAAWWRDLYPFLCLRK